MIVEILGEVEFPVALKATDVITFKVMTRADEPGPIYTESAIVTVVGTPEEIAVINRFLAAVNAASNA